MIEKPVLGMKVKLLENNCCYGAHKKGEIGTIIKIESDDCFRVSTKDTERYGSSWWHLTKCVTEVKGNT